MWLIRHLSVPARLSGFKEGQVLGVYADGLTCARVCDPARASRYDREGAKATQLNAFAINKGLRNAVKNVSTMRSTSTGRSLGYFLRCGRLAQIWSWLCDFFVSSSMLYQ